MERQGKFFNSNVTHTGMAGGYLKYLKSVGYSDKTLGSYYRNLSLFENYLSGIDIRHIREVTKKTVQGYFEQVMNTENAHNTKYIKLKCVRKLFDWYVATGKLLINPTDEIPRLAGKKPRYGRILTISEMKRLLEVPDLSRPDQLRNRTIMEILYSSALRINELMDLNVYDISLADRTITVNNGKGRCDRVVPVGKRAAGFAKEYAETVRKAWLKGKPVIKTFFLNRHGAQLTDISVRRFLKLYRERANINKPVSPHTLRRTCATHLLTQGADIRYIQKLLGHKKLSTTEVYTRIEPKDVKNIHKKIKDK